MNHNVTPGFFQLAVPLFSKLLLLRPSLSSTWHTLNTHIRPEMEKVHVSNQQLSRIPCLSLLSFMNVCIEGVRAGLTLKHICLQSNLC